MLKDKIALITGAGGGIGRAIALKMASLNAKVIINYRKSEKEALELLKEIEKKGGKAFTIKGDVSDFEACKEMISALKDEFGRIDILVNNAGITRDNLIMRMKEEDFDKVISTNLKGTFNCIRHVTPLMVKERYGRIINVSSVVGVTGNAGQANYAASKAGILGLTKSAARELASRGITVNAVAPGFINTNMTEILNSKVKENILNSIPLKRIGEPEDVANLIAFLSSQDASYITGQVINVDGGMVM